MEDAILRGVAHGARIDDVKASLHRLEQLRDPETHQHEKHARRLVTALCASLGMTREAQEAYAFAAELHDIGKVVLPDSVLKKPGALNLEERSAVQSHCLAGHQILSAIDHPWTQLAAEVALAHHERWDGSGYPHACSGEDIPLSARLVAVCDVYSALRERRAYKPAIGHAEAMDILLEGDPVRGHRGAISFDPALTAQLARAPDLFDISDMFAAPA